MWFLRNLGTVAERMFGNWTFLMLYVLSGLAGSVFSLLWNPTTLSVGASGAVFGIAGGLIVFWQVGQVSIPKSVVASYSTSLFSVVASNLVYGAMNTGIDNAAHVGGLVAGLAMGAALHRPLPATKKPAPLLLLVVGVRGAKGRLANDALAKSIDAEVLVNLGEFEIRPGVLYFKLRHIDRGTWTGKNLRCFPIATVLRLGM